jgi:DNA-binding transcriptional ArsR family regulator
MSKINEEKKGAAVFPGPLREDEIEKSAEILKSLANPARLRLVNILVGGEKTVSQLSAVEESQAERYRSAEKRSFEGLLQDQGKECSKHAELPRQMRMLPRLTARREDERQGASCGRR